MGGLMRADTPAEVRSIAALGTPPRLLGTAPHRREDAAAYLAAGGYRTPTGPGPLLRRLQQADLCGRGGAGFPVARKLEAVLAQPPGPRIVVANVAEGEPASVKDRFLGRRRPHLVLDGVAHAAAAVAADRAYVQVSDVLAAQSLTLALAEHPAGIPVTVSLVAEAYVAGEESAVVRHLGGGPALPRAKPPRAFEAGVDGLPTLVHNAETLAAIALAADDRSPLLDSFLATVSGLGLPPALYELRHGHSLEELSRHHFGPAAAPQSFLIGGFFGGLLRPEPGLLLSPDGLRAVRAQLGCGAVIALGPEDCPVSAAADVLAFLTAEGAQQCGACIRGTAAMSQVLRRLCEGSAGARDAEQLEGWSRSLRGRGACGLLDAAAANAAALLRAHPDAVTDHLATPCLRCVGAGEPPRRTRFALELP